MHTGKSTIRKELLTRRRAMGVEKALGLSEAVAARAVAAVDWAGVRSVHTYTPMARLREVDATLVVEAVQLSWPGIRWAGWRREGGNYTSVWMDSSRAGEPVTDGFEYDVVIVPLLAFNIERFRIGYGGGMYDRFLAGQPQAVTMGLCYDYGRCEFTPEPHDIALTMVVTESGVY